jgi:hypothetical protein
MGKVATEEKKGNRRGRGKEERKGNWERQR